MSLVVGMICVTAWVAVGWWPMRVLGALLVGSPWYGRAALACALGAAITGLVQVLLSACGFAAGAGAPCALVVLSLAGNLWRRTPVGAHGIGNAHSPEPAPPAWLAMLLIVVACVSLAAAAGTPFRSDGSKFWAPKARELSQWGAREAPSLHDSARLGVHRDYPLLVPALLAPVFANSPLDAMAGPKLALGALTVALLGVLTVLLPRCGRRGVVLLAAFAAMPLITSLDVRESAVAAGFVDGVDALFLLLLVVAVERVRGSPESANSARAAAAWGVGRAPLRDGGGLLLATLAGAALASTKLEGAVEAALVLVSACLVGPRRGALLAVGGATLLLAVPTFVIAAGVAPDASGFDLARLMDPALWQARLLPVLAGLAGLLVDVSSFGLLPLLLVVLACGGHGETAAIPATTDAAPGGEARRRRMFCMLLGTGALAFLLLSYLSTNMQAERHMDTSAHRLLWHWLPAITWLVARPHAARDAAGHGAFTA